MLGSVCKDKELKNFKFLAAALRVKAYKFYESGYSKKGFISSGAKSDPTLNTMCV